MVIAGIILILILLPAAYAGILAAPWVPTWRKDLDRILKLIPSKKNLTFVELGCGSGTVMLEIARLRSKIQVVGYEIQPILFLICWLRIKLNHLKNVEVKFADFFKADLSSADVVFLYWTEKTTHKIREIRGIGEIGKQTIISYAFPVVGRKPVKVDEEKGRLPIFVYSFHF